MTRITLATSYHHDEPKECPWIQDGAGRSPPTARTQPSCYSKDHAELLLGLERFKKRVEQLGKRNPRVPAAASMLRPVELSTTDLEVPSQEGEEQAVTENNTPGSNIELDVQDTASSHIPMDEQSTGWEQATSIARIVFPTTCSTVYCEPHVMDGQQTECLSEPACRAESCLPPSEQRETAANTSSLEPSEQDVFEMDSQPPVITDRPHISHRWDWIIHLVCIFLAVFTGIFESYCGAAKEPRMEATKDSKTHACSVLNLGTSIPEGTDGDDARTRSKFRNISDGRTRGSYKVTTRTSAETPPMADNSQEPRHFGNTSVGPVTRTSPALIPLMATAMKMVSAL